MSNISKGSKVDADMEINIAKTECMHVKRQQRVGAPNQQDAESVCKYRCDHVGCGWIFGNKRGLKIHQGKWCNWCEYYNVE